MDLSFIPRARLLESLEAGFTLVPGHDYDPNDWAILVTQSGQRVDRSEVLAQLSRPKPQHVRNKVAAYHSRQSVAKPAQPAPMRTPASNARMEILEEENRQLKERIANLSGRSELDRACNVFRLTKTEGSIFMLVLTRGCAEYGHIRDVMYEDGEREEADMMDLAIRTHIKRMRRKIRPHGVDFETVYCIGYRMSDECRATARRMISARDSRSFVSPPIVPARRSGEAAA